MNIDSNKIFDVINSVFGITDDYKEFSERYGTKEKDNLYKILAEYYNYMLSKSIFIPFNVYMRIISSLPLLQSKNGSIYYCKNCGYFVSFNTNIVNNTKLRRPYIHHNINNLNSFFSVYITKYHQNGNTLKKIKLNKNIDITLTNTFNNLHNKHSINCTSNEVIRYKNIYDYKTKVLSSLIEVNKIFPNNYSRNISDYITYIIEKNIFTELSKNDIDKINNYFTILNNKNISFNIIPIYAVITYIILNKLIIENESISLDIIINTLKKRFDIKTYSPFSLQKILNMFNISTTTFYKYIDNIIILKKEETTINV